MAIDTLELFSFVHDGSIGRNEKVYYMEFPKTWRNFIELDKNEYTLKVKPKKLGAKIQAVFPAIFYINWKKDEPWLLSDKAIDPFIIKNISLHWFAAEKGCVVSELPKEVVNESLTWNETEVAELYRKYKKGDWKFNWFPGLLARKFCDQTHFISIPNGYTGELKFHHVYFNNVHECMSEPIRNKESHGYFSYVVRITLKNRGGLPEPSIINVSFGIRRFLQKGIYNNDNLDSKCSGSILFSVKNPFFSDGENSSFYTILNYKKTKAGNTIWVDGADQLFADLLQISFKPMEILRNPMEFMKNDQISALVVYSDRVFRSKINLSKVKSGIGLPEKWALFDYFKQTFPKLKPLETFFKINTHKDSMGNDILPLQHPYSPNETIKITFWGEQELYNTAIATYLNEKIFFEDERGNYWLNAEPPLKLEFELKDTTEFMQALHEKHPHDYRVKQIKKKASEDKNKSKLKMSLVQIDKKENYLEHTDPKHANRMGFAAANQVSQFIYPMDMEESVNTLKARIENSLYDLLTDHGFLPAKVNRIDQDSVFLGFSLINGKLNKRGNVCLPVATRLYKNEVKVRIFGDTWKTINQALITASQLSSETFLENPTKNLESVNKYKSFFQRIVNETLYEFDTNLVIFINAKLRYQKWEEITNSSINYDKLPFNLEHHEAQNRVRVIRVNNTDDVNQYRINPEGKIEENWRQGLFKDPTSGNYYSVGARPDTMKGIAKSFQKYNDPTILVQHQRLVEFIPLGTNVEEERDQLAKHAHKLRNLNMAYKFHVILPYPLDIVKAIKKYLPFTHEDYINDDSDVFEDWTYVDENDQVTFVFNEL